MFINLLLTKSSASPEFVEVRTPDDTLGNFPIASNARPLAIARWLAANVLGNYYFPVEGVVGTYPAGVVTNVEVDITLTDGTSIPTFNITYSVNSSGVLVAVIY